MNVSRELRASLRVFGFAKVAAQTMHDQQEYVGEIESIAGSVRSVAMKLAANLKNEALIAEGIASLHRSREL